MAKLYFRYGAMGSSKTANALMVRYNYAEKGKQAVLLKPKVERRDGQYIVQSRIGLSAECEIAEDYLDHWRENMDARPVDAVIVDEVQFLNDRHIEMLADIVDDYGVPVICYGLKIDFRGKLFPGTARLIELADEIEEIPTICWCGRKARFNARVINGKMVTDGEQILLGGNESYVSLCRKHYRARDLGRHGAGEDYNSAE